MSLRSRVALLVGVCLLAATALSGLGAYRSTRTELDAGTDHFLLDRVERYTGAPSAEFLRGARAGRGGRPNQITRELVGGVSIVDPDAIVQVVDSRGDLLLGVSDAAVLRPSAATLAAAATSSEPVLEDVAVAGVSYRSATARLGNDTFVQVGRNDADAQVALAGLRNRLVAIAAVVTAVGTAIGWLVSRSLTRPIERLAASVEHVAATEELDTEIVVSVGGEVGRLAGSFATMLDALHTSRRQQHELVLDAGHELRTPITTLRTSVELLKRDDLSDAHRAQLTAAIDAELAELTNLVTELVHLGSDHRIDDPVVNVDLAEVADRVADRARRRHSRPISVVGDAAGVQGRTALLERAITNLVDNAVKFSPTGTPVEIHVSTHGVEVHDAGPGIDPDDQARVFGRFYRAPSARTKPGSGLGLAIVAQAAAAHGGQPVVGTSDLGGAKVGFTV